MRNFYSSKIILIIFSVFASTKLHAQTLPVGFFDLEDAYRRSQLTGHFDSTLSFTSRPLYNSILSENSNLFDSDSTLKKDKFNPSNGILYLHNKSIIKILPFGWRQQYNGKVPYGWNDGSMIPARGYQSVISGGFFAKFGPLHIQLMPEFVTAQNKNFEGFSLTVNSPATQAIQNVYDYYFRNGIDLPEKFGTGSFSKANWGHSSIRLQFGAISFGLSNENLWWGPGVRNALVMSNNASGFKHLTLNTVKPIHSKIGSFEGQLIVGRLDGSDYSSNKLNDWRYTNGLMLSYQPKWISGLFLGFTRHFQVYNDSLENGLTDYLPVLSGVLKKHTKNEDAKARDQVLSLFGRWVWPEANAELYLEYGWNDHSSDLRDFLQGPEHSRAYLFGIKKLIPIRNRMDEFIQFNVEVTQLAQTTDRMVREAGSWYMHGMVLHGYTQKGEVMGAGIGPGSNLQSIEFSWVKGIKLTSLQFERYVHNNDFYFAAFNNTLKYKSHWVDFSAGLKFNRVYKNFLINGQLKGIYSQNYQWGFKNYDENIKDPRYDIFNLHAQLGLAYRF